VPRIVRFDPDAIREAEESRDWYALRSTLAAARFLAELDNALAEVATNPDRWPVREGGTRRYIFSRFPFALVYRVDGDHIEIIAVQHGRRRPGYWRDR